MKKAVEEGRRAFGARGTIEKTRRVPCFEPKKKVQGPLQRKGEEKAPTFTESLS